MATASLASFLVLLDDSAVALALSALGEDLGLGLTGLEWVVNLYTLVFAVLTLPAGLLADRLGARRLLCAGLIGFASVSLLAGLAGRGDVLLVLRAAQGAAAALVAPAALAVVTTWAPDGRRGAALGVWSGVSAGALAAGPLVGAIVTQALGWRWIFFVNVPLAAALLVAAVATVPPSPGRSRAGRWDLAGLLWSATALAALVTGLTQANAYGWTSPRLWGLLAVAAAAAALFVRAERRASWPLVDLRLFRVPNFAAGNLLGLVNLAVMCSLFFFMALFLQRALLLSPLAAGLALLPFTALIAAVAPFAGRWADRVGTRWPIVAGLAFVSLGLLLLSGIRSGTGVSGILPGMAVAGLGLGLAASPITSAALGHVPERATGIASATVSVSRLIGLALGVAVMGAVVAVGWPGGTVDTAAQRAAFASALGTGFAVNAALALVSAAGAAAAIRPGSARAGRPRPARPAG